MNRGRSGNLGGLINICCHIGLFFLCLSCLGRNLIIDPISEEESFQDGSLMVTCMPSQYEVTQLTITGKWSTANLNEAMQLCLDACSKLAKIMRSCLKEAASASKD
ncbi:EXOSOME COMPLEX COMPONENT [Salix koriyanagi]|uniref:EXOSOME COMPLEX COMPONENT n=1 Tax=Salix koriyanagi TaxID=2511006 RepID=A0A9Q0UZY8_9ROSI|nr:EXOSOME COMPLEX COMPONENT [Salix koriyanagi]